MKCKFCYKSNKCENKNKINCNEFVEVYNLCICCKNKIVEDYKPKFCCSGSMYSECGCMGMPVNEEECVCDDCKEKYKNKNSEASQENFEIEELPF